MPLVLPPVVGGVALLLALGRRGVVGRYLDEWFGWTLPFTPAAVVLAETFVAMPFLVMTLEGAFRAADRGLDEAAATLGASRMTVFRRVTLPLVAPVAVAGAVLSWARALGEFGATITFAGNFPGRTQTMPVAVYIALETDPDGAIALSLVLLAVSVTVLVRCATAGCRRAAMSTRATGGTRWAAARRVARGTSPSTPRSTSPPARSRRPRAERGRQDHAAAGRWPGWNRSARAVELGGTVLDDRRRVFVPPEERRVGLVFQDYRLFPHLSALENVAFSARSAGVARRTARDVARQWLVAARTGRAGRPPPGQLSVARPNGSPWPGPWPPTRASCCSTSRWPHWMPGPGWTCGPRCAGTSPTSTAPVVVVTHDPVEAMVMADRLLVVEGGRVVQEGTPGRSPAAR